jgi:hypothetical protein
MTFRLWPSKPPHGPVVPLVALSDEYSGKLRQAAERMHVPVLNEIPLHGDFVLALAPTQTMPANVPAHIPTVDPSSPDLPRLLEAALLYLEAHHRIKK